MINSIKNTSVLRSLSISVGALLFIVFAGSAWAISLRFKLEMLGYNEEEIRAIVSGKKSRIEIDRKIRMEMLGLSEAKPSPPPDPPNGEGKRPERIAHNLEAVKPALPVSHKDHTPKEELDLLGKAKPYLPIIKDVAAKTHVGRSLIMAVIKVESDFDPKAVSPKGAMGLMQLLPSTAKDLGVADPFDPKENIYGGARYLSNCINTFEDIALALAAYNAGPELVGEARKIPPYPETENFVKDVFHYKKLYDQLLRPKS